MPYREEAIINQADQLGQRCGNVVMKEHAGNHDREPARASDDRLDGLVEQADRLLSELTESYTTFTYSDSEAVRLVPRMVSESEVVWRQYGVKRDVDSDTLATRAASAANTRPLAEKALTAAGPVLGFAGVELATSSLVEGGVGAIAGLGLAKAVTGLRGRRRRNHYLNAVNERVLELSQAAKAPETIYLPNTYEKEYLAPAELEELKNQKIQVVSAQGMEVPIYDILQWIGDKSFGSMGTEMRFHFSGYKYRLKTEGVVVELNTSLWRLFRQGANKDHIFAFEDEHNRNVKDFIKSREGIARRAGLTLVPTKPPKYKGLFMDDSEESEQPEAATEWLDAQCSLICLPPGRLVRDLLVNSKDPNKLWQQIVPELAALQEQFTQLYTVKKDLKIVHDRASAAGVAAEGDAERIADLRQREDGIRQHILDATLSVAGAAMLQDRQRRYNESRETLLKSIGHTSQAEDQWGAIALFDKGINAVIMQLDPDSEEAIQTSKELVSYLSSTAKYIDGTEEVHNQVYAGMQKRFPQLQLP